MSKIKLTGMTGAELRQLIADAEKQLELVKPTQVVYQVVIDVENFETRTDDASDPEVMKDTIYDILLDELGGSFSGVRVSSISINCVS